MKITPNETIPSIQLPVSMKMPRAIGADNTNAVNIDNWRGLRFLVEAMVKGTRYKAQATRKAQDQKAQERHKNNRHMQVAINAKR